ncbi:MAG: thiamine pyrophosphate-binding protein, partial [Proteobacteria bacterium]|nr:thiamine pyrophosphate-binding protein [Pseudomonadota bacterium]
MSPAGISAAQIVVEALRQCGADCVFGLPGTQNVALFDALHGSRLRLVVATSEMSAAMMANGYYRASGRPGVLVTIPGPGFTWSLTGLAEAALDSAALLHITNLPARSPGRHFQLQALDQVAMAAPVARRLITIERAEDAAARIAEAWRECRIGEPGPVVVQVSREAWQQTHSGNPDSIAAAETPRPPSPEEVSAV